MQSRTTQTALLGCKILKYYGLNISDILNVESSDVIVSNDLEGTLCSISQNFRNQNLRQEFNMNFNLYTNSIQSKMFNMKVSDGPKRIEDFE